jgi:hypothetical protein
MQHRLHHTTAAAAAAAPCIGLVLRTCASSSRFSGFRSLCITSIDLHIQPKEVQQHAAFSHVTYTCSIKQTATAGLCSYSSILRIPADRRMSDTAQDAHPDDTPSLMLLLL